jgi:hypothetical protein
MSLVEICLKFEEVISYLSSSTEETSNLSKFFTSYRKIVENFSGNLQRLSETIKINTNPESNFNTLSLALLTLKEHLKKVAENNLQLVKNLQLDVIEPLDLFTEHFISMFSELKSKGLEVFKTVNSAQGRLQKQRKDYYKIAAESEKNTRAGTFEEKDSSKALQRLQQAQEVSLNRYIEGLMDVNSLWDDYDRKMPQIMEDLQQNEESRIHFIKNSLEKYIKYYQKCENLHLNNIEKLGEIISNINSLLDIRVFVDLHKSKDQVFRETFVNYEEYKQKLAGEDLEDLNIESNVNQLLSQSNPSKSSGISSETFNKLSEMISTSEGRRMFIESLKTNSNSSALASESITQIAALIKEAMNLMIKESEYDAEVFVTIIDLSGLFYCVQDNHKRFLCNFISPHKFWLDSKRWMQGLEYAICTRLASLKENSKEKGVLQYFGIFSSKALEEKSEKSEKAEKVSAYIMISQFILQMSRLQVPQALAATVITTAAKDYEIDSERKVLLLTELFSRSSEKIRVKPKNFRETCKNLTILRKSSKFLNDEELLQLGLTCKEMWKRAKVLKGRRVLIESREVLDETRRKMWVQLLETEKVPVDYQETLKLVETSKELLGDINEIIDLDVVRCFQRVSSITTSNLSNILKVYAYKNKEIGYCQGMNYIAGTFFQVFNSEELSFKSLFSLISSFKLNSLFKIELSKIKKLFFILDRLTGTFLPSLNETFKESWVFADNYSSGWLITLFASVFHSNLEIIVQIWDIFLCFGWKGLFRVCLQILSQLSSSLSGCSFEEILAELSSIQTKSFFTKDFFLEASKLKVTNRQIHAIKQEFRSLKHLTTHN